MRDPQPSSSSLLLSSLELSDKKVYEPYIRALLGTTSHSCEVVVLETLNPTLPMQEALDEMIRWGIDAAFKCIEHQVPSSSLLLSILDLSDTQVYEP